MRRVFPYRFRVLVVLASAAVVLLAGSAAGSADIVWSCQAPNCPITINDNPSPVAFQDRAASPYPSQISFPHGDPCCPTIDKVTVTLTGFTHGSLADVDVLLVREASGQRPAQVVELMSDVGPSATPVQGLTLTFDDDAPNSLPSNVAPTSRTYKPTNYSGAQSSCAGDSPSGSTTGDPFPPPAPPAPSGGYSQSLSIFNGTLLGDETWHLYVGDDCIGGSGAVSSWSLFFATSETPGQFVFLSKSADSPSVNAGSPIGFTLTAGVHPFSDRPEEDVTIEDPLPSGPGIDWALSPSNSECSISGAVGGETLSCLFQVIWPGQARSVHVSSPTSDQSCGTYTNTGTVRSSRPPHQASATTRVTCPTAVSVSSFAATRTGRAVHVRWRSPSETGTLGFNVFREEDGRRVKLNPVVIPSRPGLEQRYSWLDRRPPLRGQVLYWLQSVSVDGARSWHGPRAAK